MFERLSSALHNIATRLRGSRLIREDDLTEIVQQVRQSLLDSDVPQQLAEDIIGKLRASVVAQQRIQGVKPAEQIIHALQQQLIDLLGGEPSPLVLKRGDVLMVVGLQGSGKTTTLAKLAYRMKQEHPGWRILMGSLDYYRPAAREQLAQLAGQIQVDYASVSATEPIGAAREISQCYRSNGYDLLLVDTAGRLQTDAALMEELVAVHGICRPTDTILVLDSMIGQASLGVAKEFAKAVPVSGGILTKIDSGARAGIALAFRTSIKQPLLFLGVGELRDDLEPLIPARMVQRLFGEGDLATLAERAQGRIAEQERLQAEKALRSGKMTLNDFAAQLKMMRSLGSMMSMARYLPRELSIQVTPEQMEKGEKEIGMFGAIISSMTPRERLVPALLTSSRKKRVARGAGVSVADVNRLLTAFEELQRYATMMKNFGYSQQKPRVR